MSRIVLAVALCSAGVVFAQTPAPAQKKAPASIPDRANPGAPAAAPSAPGEAPMMEPKPGPETVALKPFAQSSTMTGTVPAGAFGPNSPEMPTRAKSTCKWILDGLWVACDITETTGSGKQAMKWTGHWVFGWDFLSKSYRGTMTSTMGDQMAMKGTLEGAKMVWESAGELKGPPGTPSKFRITEDASEPKAIKFTDEAFVDGKWVTTGTAVEKPTK